MRPESRSADCLEWALGWGLRSWDGGKLWGRSQTKRKRLDWEEEGHEVQTLSREGGAPDMPQPSSAWLD